MRAAARRALPHGDALDVLQPGEVRHPAGGRTAERTLARERPAGDEHVRRDHPGHELRRRTVRALERRALARWASCSWRSPSSAPRPASASRRSAPRDRASPSPGTRSAKSAAASRALWPDKTLWITTIGISYFWLLGTLFQQVLLPWGQETFADRRSGRDAPLYVPRDRHRRRQPAGRPSVRRQGRARPRAARFDRPRRLQPAAPRGAVELLVRRRRPRAPRHLPAASSPCRSTPCSSSGRPTTRRAAFWRRTTCSTRSACSPRPALFWLLGAVLQVHEQPDHPAVRPASRSRAPSTWCCACRTSSSASRCGCSRTRSTASRSSGGPTSRSADRRSSSSNHVSVVDGALVGASLQRFVRFMVYGPYFRLPVVNWLMRRMHAIPVTAGNRREVVAALDRARAELAAGHVVCIFAEGAISRTGNLLPFQRGFERIVRGLDVPIVPVYLDRVWGSVFSFKRGRFFWKLPERLPYPVTVAWGTPLPSTATAAEVRQAITELGSTAMSIRREPGARLHVEFMRSARRRWSHLAMADTTGQKLTYGRALIGAFAFGRVLERRTPGESVVGTLLPASAGAVLANIGLLHRRPAACQSQLHDRAGSARPRHSTGRASRRSSRRGSFSRRRACPEMPGMVVPRRSAQGGHGQRQAPRARSRRASRRCRS